MNFFLYQAYVYNKLDFLNCLELFKTSIENKKNFFKVLYKFVLEEDEKFIQVFSDFINLLKKLDQGYSHSVEFSEKFQFYIKSAGQEEPSKTLLKKTKKFLEEPNLLEFVKDFLAIIYGSQKIIGKDTMSKLRMKYQISEKCIFKLALIFQQRNVREWIDCNMGAMSTIIHNSFESRIKDFSILMKIHHFIETSREKINFKDPDSYLFLIRFLKIFCRKELDISLKLNPFLKDYRLTKTQLEDIKDVLNNEEIVQLISEPILNEALQFLDKYLSNYTPKDTCLVS